jgi:rhodanese-related sulfurtransferase
MPDNIPTGEHFMLKTALITFLLILSRIASAEVHPTNNHELQQLLAQGIPIIDIRRPEEWRQTGVVENSHLLTFFDQRGHYNLEKWLAELNKIAAKDQPFILICRTGNRTGILSRALSQQLGYSRVYNVTDGITAWKRQNLPVVGVQ